MVLTHWHTLFKASIFTTEYTSWVMVSVQCSVEWSQVLCVYVFILTFAHASVFMTEDNEMQDAFSMVFFLRLQYMALSLYFRRHLYKRFYLHDWRLELKDGFDTMFFLKDWLMGLSLASLPLWNMLPSSLQMMGFERPFPTPLLTESYVCGSFLKVQHTYEETLVSLLINIGLYTTLNRWNDWRHYHFVFTQLFWTAFLFMTDVSEEMLSV